MLDRGMVLFDASSEVTTLACSDRREISRETVGVQLIRVDFYAEYVAHRVSKLRSRQAAQQPGRRLKGRWVRNHDTDVDGPAR